MKFLALKLKKDAASGEIQPVKLTLKEPNPCIPLVLTQVAAPDFARPIARPTDRAGR